MLYKLYLLYLCILPSVATFLILQRIGPIEWIGIPLFFLGIGIVAVFLSMAISYTRPTAKPWIILFLIIDGPIFALFANVELIDISNIITELFLIENIAIWVSIGYLARTSGRPTFGQMSASLILAGTFLFAIIGLYSLSGFFDKPWYLFIPIIIGIIEAIWIKYWILHEDRVEVNAFDTIPFMVGGLFLWLICLIVGGCIANAKYGL